MEGVRAALARTRERVDSYTLELQRHGLESVEREVRWLNELIAAERQSEASGRTAGRSPRPDRHRDRTRQRFVRLTLFAEARRSHPDGCCAVQKVRVAIVGVGNCASSLVQGVEYYKDADPTRPACRASCTCRFGDYHVSDVELVAAFDVDAKKVGRGPRRGHLRQREQHHQVLRRAADRGDRAARPHV